MIKFPVTATARSERPAPDRGSSSEQAMAFPANRLSDAQLAHAAAAGDRQAWDELWDRHSRSVRRVLSSCLGSDPAVDDLVQDAFIALFRAFDRLERPEAVRAFLLGTAARLAAFELRTRGRRFRWLRLTPRGTLPELPVSQDEALRETVLALGRVIQQLGPDLRVAFVLRYVEGLSAKEVASALGYSESKAKRRITRARDRVLLLAGRDPVLVDFVSGESLGDSHDED